MIKIYFIYLRSLIAYLVRSNSRFSISFKTLYRSHTFRVPDELKKDRLLGVRFVKKAWSALGYKSSEKFEQRKDLLYDGNPKQKEERLAYLQEVGVQDVNFVTINEIPGVSKVRAILFMFLFLPLFLWLAVISFFSSNRGSIALSILSITQNYLLLRLTRDYHIKKVIYFFPFENDANFNACILISDGIKVLKVPGPNPLHRFHTYMVSSEVALCTGFQFEQYEMLKENWLIDGVVKWPLYRFQDFKGYLNKDANDNFEYEIGFISSGIWKRRELGLQSLESDYESEEELIEWLKEFMAKEGYTRLFIYLHPIESKTKELYEEAKAYYSSVFKTVELAFPAFGQNSFQYFHKVDLAFSSHSTTNLQRLFCGYKVFYTPMKYKKPLFPNTTIDKISIMEKEVFFEQSKKALKMNSQEFMDEYGLMEYHYSSVI